MTSSPSTETLAAGAVAKDPRRWLALAVIASSQLMVILDASIVNIALPSAQRDLGISDADRQWVVTAYTLAFGGLLLLGGRIADDAGRKRALLIGLGGFAFASALGGLAGNAELLFAARALQGMFAALLAPAALSLITVTFTMPKERARAFGVFGAISGGGAAIGLILGGVLTEYASWRWCLGVNVPIAILVILAAIPIVKESKAQGSTKYDIPGAVLSTLGLVSLVYGFTQAAKPDVGWGAASTIGFLVAAGVLLVAFVLWEQRTSNPLLPLRIALDRNRGGSYLVFFLVGAGLFAMFLFLTFYLQVVLQYTPLHASAALLPFSAGIIVGAGLMSQLMPKLGPKPLMITGLALATIGMLWLTQIDVGTSYATHVLPSQLVMSVGMAAVFVPASSTALVGIDPHDAGVGSALLNTTQQIGGSIGTALLNTIATSAAAGFVAANATGRPTPLLLQQAAVHSYVVAFWICAGVFVAAAVVVGALLRPGVPDLSANEGLDDVAVHA